MKARLEQHKVEVVGVTDHDGFIESIYFFDPNDFRLELTVEVAPQSVVKQFAIETHEELRRWTSGKRSLSAAPAPASGEAQ